MNSRKQFEQHPVDGVDSREGRLLEKAFINAGVSPDVLAEVSRIVCTKQSLLRRTASHRRVSCELHRTTRRDVWPVLKRSRLH